MDKSSPLGVSRHQRQKAASRPSEEAVREASHMMFTEEDFAETKCGLGAFSPPWLQVLARKEAYLVVFCLVALIQGMFFNYTVAVISTLEKRFKLTSKQTGAILSGNDVSQIILAMVLGYYGTYGHRPRWVGVGVLCAAISCFLAALPHFIYGPGADALALLNAAEEGVGGGAVGNTSLGTKRSELCHNVPEESCGGEARSEAGGGDGGGGGSVGGGTAYLGPVVLFFFSQFFVGISMSLFNSIGVTYLDDNVSRKSYPLYFCVTVLLRIVGPVLGFLVGGRCLSLWIDPYRTPNLNPRDPRWLGAWWLGFVFLGCGLALVGSMLFLFPRRLPTTLRREAKKVVRQAEKEKAQDTAGGEAGEEADGEAVVGAVDVGSGSPALEYFATLAKAERDEAEKPTLANLRRALGRLFTNPLWLGNLLNTVSVVFAFSGYMNFKPKYLENQFRRSAAEANYYTGMVSLTSVLMGTALGGSILRWGRPRARYVAAYNIVMSIFLCVCYTLFTFIKCPGLTVVGPVEGSPALPCSEDCGCSERFSPMCAADNVTLFYSPCYAACTAVDTLTNPAVFSECDCINSTFPSSSRLPSPNAASSSSSSSTLPFFTADTKEGSGGSGSGVSGYCPDDCEASFYNYLITQVVLETVTSTGRVGGSVIIIRSVADEDRGLALGTLAVFTSFLSFIPAPIVTGAIIDSACLVWEKSCGQTGNCWLYDSDMFRTTLHLVPAVCFIFAALGDLIVFWYSHRMDLYGERSEGLQLHMAAPATPVSPGPAGAGTPQAQH